MTAHTPETSPNVNSALVQTAVGLFNRLLKDALFMAQPDEVKLELLERMARDHRALRDDPEQVARILLKMIHETLAGPKPVAVVVDLPPRPRQSWAETWGDRRDEPEDGTFRYINGKHGSYKLPVSLVGVA